MRRNILLLSEKDFLTLPIVRSANREKYNIFVMGPALSAGRFSRYIARYFPYSGSIRSSTTDIIHMINTLSKKYNI